MSRGLLVLLSAFLFATSALADVQQSGTVTPGHPAAWVTSGVIGDGGASTNGYLTNWGIFANGGLPACITASTTPRQTFNPASNPYSQLCLYANQGGNAGLSLNSYNGAAADSFIININGINYPFPGTGTGNVSGPPVTTLGYVPTWGNLTGSLLGTGLPVGTTGNNTIVETTSGGTVSPGVLPGPTSSTLGGINSLAVVSHKWINTISTAGAPAATQPAFTDLSGNIAVNQMANGSGASSSTFWRGDGTWATASGAGGCTAAGANCVGWYNIVSYGADPTGVADSTSAIASAVAAAVSGGGGTVYAPCGVYSVSSMTLTANYKLNFFGDGSYCTKFIPSTVSGNFFNVNASSAVLRGFSIVPSSGMPAGSDGVYINAGFVYLDDVHMYGAGAGTSNYWVNGIHLEANSAYQATINNTLVTGASNALLQVGNGPITVTISIHSPGVVTWSNHGRIANEPIIFGTTGALPSGLTAGTTYYVVGSSITTNSFEVSATPSGSAINTTGTQSGTQTAWSGAQTATGVVNNLQAACGSSSPGNGVLVYVTGGITLASSGVIGCQHGFVTYPSTGQNSFAVFLEQFGADTSTSDGIAFYTNGGTVGSAEVDDSWGSSSTGTGHGLSIVGSVNGIAVNGGQYINNAGDGIYLGTGASNVTINGAAVCNNSTSGSGTYHGIAVAANVSNFIISGVQSGNCGYPANQSWASNQNYGIFVASGTSNHYNIINNNLPGNVSGTISDGGSGTDKLICGNFGTGGTTSDSGCGGSSSVSSVANSDGTLTISPTTGSVIASLALGHANTWTGTQTFSNATVTGTLTIPDGGSGSAWVVSASGRDVINVNAYGVAIGYTSNPVFNNGTGFQPYTNNAQYLGYPGSIWAGTYTNNLSVSGTATSADNGTWSSSGISGTSINNTTIGASTAAAGHFTTLSASSTVSGSGFSSYLASPPAIGGSSPAAGSFTTLSASSTVSGSGFSSYLASPPAIGGTSAAAGTFTALTATSSIKIPDDTWITTASGYQIVKANSSGIALGDSSNPIFVIGSAFYPYTDGAPHLGYTGQRWDDVWATNGTIQTSDGRLKTDIADEPLGLAFLEKLHPVIGRWISNADGTHHWLLAQEVEDALNGQPFAGLVKGLPGKACVPGKETAGCDSLSYTEFVPVLIKGLQDLDFRFKVFLVLIGILSAVNIVLITKPKFTERWRK